MCDAFCVEDIICCVCVKALMCDAICFVYIMYDTIRQAAMIRYGIYILALMYDAIGVVISCVYSLRF